jgi:large subunit ribosomal protein L10
MALTKEQKQKILEDLKDKIARQRAMVFADFTGLKVKDLSDLRRKLKAADCELKVAKKTLMGIVFKEAGIETKELSGEIALVFGYKDALAPAKIVYQFTQTNPNLKILAGFFENKLREAEEIITLAQLPTREELLARLVGSIQAPVSNFVRILEANIKGLMYALSAIKK